MAAQLLHRILFDCADSALTVELEIVIFTFACSAILLFAIAVTSDPFRISRLLQDIADTSASGTASLLPEIVRFPPPILIPISTLFIVILELSDIVSDFSPYTLMPMLFVSVSKADIISITILELLIRFSPPLM